MNIETIVSKVNDEQRAFSDGRNRACALAAQQIGGVQNAINDDGGCKMKVLVTGARGQLGHDVVKELQRRKIECRGIGREDVDIVDGQAVEQYLKDYQPDVVIHCAAYTAVDRAEDEEEKCWAVNVKATEHIAKLCRDLNAKMIYISTDYVFEGMGDAHYEVNDPVSSLSIYGKSKLAGEDAVKKWLIKYYVVRISWVFGVNGNNFVKTMLRLGKERDEINVVSDQFGSPTYTADLAPLLCEMAVEEKYGTYHATNEGFCSWAEFAQEIFRQAGLKCRVNPISSEQYPMKAKRPLNSRLSKKSLSANGFECLPQWTEAVKRYLDEVKVVR